MSKDEKTETNRDRVRRLFIHKMVDPVVGLGMTFDRKKTSSEKFEEIQTRLADELGWMGDDGLRLLYDFLKTKGEGRNRNLLPCRATVLAYAELAEHCPIEKIPSMASWFGSIEGPKAKRDGTLVATFRFIRKFKRPPVLHGDVPRIALRSKEILAAVNDARHRIEIGRAGDRERHEVTAYERDEAAALALLKKELA